MIADAKYYLRYLDLLRSAVTEADTIDDALLAAGIAYDNTPHFPEAGGAMFSHDIFNRRAQGILNRAVAASKKFSAAAKADLVVTLRTSDAAELSKGLVNFIGRYRLQLADLLTTTQLASLLEGAREVAGKIPIVPNFPGAVMPPATLEPAKAVALIAELHAMPPNERAAAIYELPPDQQRFAAQGLQARQQGGPPPGAFVPRGVAGATPDRIHYPIIDEAAQELFAKNVMSRESFDALDEAARQKAFTVAYVESVDTMTKIRDVMAENVRQGADLVTFRERILTEVDEGTFMSDAHMDTVYRTVVQSAFSDGQIKVLQNPFVRGGFPYVAYEAIHDDRVEADHLALESLGLEGTNMYRSHDTVFLLFRPPWRWCMPGDSLINTSLGRKRIDQISVGDLVLTHKGRFRSVVETYRTESVAELIAIELESGASCRASREHPFFTQRGWVEAASLNVSDEIYQIVDATAPHLVMLKVNDGLEVESFLNRDVSVSVGASGVRLNFNANKNAGKEKIKPKWKGLLIENEFDPSFLEGGGKCLLVTAHSNDAVNVLGRVEPHRFTSSGDHLCTNFRSARNAMDSIGGDSLFDSFGMKGIRNFTGLTTTSEFNGERLKNSPDRPELDAGNSSDVRQGDLLLDVVPDSGVDAARVNGQLCLGIIEVSGRAFWLFSHSYNCSTVKVKVKSLSVISWGKPVWNFSVDEDQSYVADGLVTHNCCRCSFIPLTIRQAARRGLVEAKQWLETGIEPQNFVPMPSFRPPPGFARFPISAPMSLNFCCQPLGVLLVGRV